MQEENSISAGSGLPENSIPPRVDAASGPADTGVPAVADSILSAGADEPSSGAQGEAALQEAPIAATSEAPPAGPEATGWPESSAGPETTGGPETTDSHGAAAKPMLRVTGIQEVGRLNKTKVETWKPTFEVEEGSVDIVAEIMQRATCVRAPLDGTPAPTGTGKYASTEALFLRLRNAISARTAQPEPVVSLLTYWVIASWFSDALALAPGLVMIGPDYEGGLVLRALRSYCRNSFMMSGISLSDLRKIDWRVTPTLLCHAPNLGERMVSLLGCTTERGYLIAGGRYPLDAYGPKAAYLGTEISDDRTPRCCAQINLLPGADACATQRAFQLVELEAQELQNQLLGYRTKNLVRVFNSGFDASALTSDTRAVAGALGACIIDAPKLQAELITLLTPLDSQRQADRLLSPEGVVLEAVLNLAHAGMAQVLAGEAASEADHILVARAERLRLNAERIGHILKKLGLATRRLGKAGRGLVLDLATLTRIHELAVMYGGVGLGQDEKNLHCPLCTENKSVM